MERLKKVALVAMALCIGALVGIPPAGATGTPLIFQVSPNVGYLAGGTRVHIFGSNLSGTTAVKFGANAGTSITNVSASEVDVTSPAGSGKVDIRVTTASGTSSISGSDIFTYTDLPMVTNLNTTVGPTAGGTTLTIFGNNLTGTTGVSFGGVAGTSIVNTSPTQISVRTPAVAASSVHVLVTTAKGTGAPSPGDVFTFSDKPMVGFVENSTGPTAGGTTVIILGSNLGGTTAVHFGANAGTGIVNTSPSQISVISPAGSAGTVHVTVTTAKGTSAPGFGDLFTYSDVPVINGLSPNTGPTAGGTRISIFGTNLGGTTAVHFGANSGTSIINSSPTQISAVSPAGSAGAVHITVTTAKGTSVIGYSDVFTYNNLPSVNYMTPNTGPLAGGTRVTINGLNLNGTTAVHFGPNAGTSITNISPTQIAVTAPAGTAGPVHVTVTTGGGTSVFSFGDVYTYNSQPTVQFLGNPSGPLGGGTRVQIFGTNLSGATSVHFGSVAGTSLTNVNPGEVDITSPSAASASVVDVTVTTGFGTSIINGNDLFTYTNQPTVSYLYPATGLTAGGTHVHITGSNLTGATAVHFGPNLGTSLANVTPNGLDIVSPAGSAGAVDVTVTTPSGTSLISGRDLFTYDNRPSVSNINPPSGPTAGGTRVQIFGGNLGGTTAVHFGSGLGTSLSNVSPTEVDATSPAGSAGAVDITVTNGSGTSAITGADVFTYGAPPAVFGLSNSSGPTAGGLRIAIFGSNLSGATAVHFGPNLGTSLTNVSPSEVDVTAPAGSGVVDVTVTTAAGTSAINGGDLFTYSNAPVVTGMSPNSGSSTVATRVHVFGTNLGGATGVKFGGVAGTSITPVSPTEVDITTPVAPAVSAGTVHVTVTTGAGTSAISGSDLYTFT